MGPETGRYLGSRSKIQVRSSIALHLVSLTGYFPLPQALSADTFMTTARESNSIRTEMPVRVDCRRRIAAPYRMGNPVIEAFFAAYRVFISKKHVSSPIALHFISIITYFPFP